MTIIVVTLLDIVRTVSLLLGCSATDNLAVVGNTISNEGNTKGNSGVSFYSSGNPRNIAFNVGT